MAKQRQIDEQDLIPGLTDMSPIGRGASSTVYRAHDRELNRWVAVKVFEADDPSDPARKRFRREREITANLGKHPHIVQVLGTGFTKTGLPYVVMEFFEQGSLADQIRKRGTYSAEETVDLGIKIADAVEAAHQAGVLHRDIKPQNVLISEYGPALADFGIARSSTNLEWSQSLDLITPMHASPEILLGGGPTPESDVYSIGSTLYTMLAGRPPHAGPPGETLLQYQVRAAKGVVPPIARPDVPPALVEVIMKSLAKEQSDRFPTPGALRDALKDVGRTLGSIPTQSSTTTVDAPISHQESSWAPQAASAASSSPAVAASASSWAAPNVAPAMVPTLPSAATIASSGVEHPTTPVAAQPVSAEEHDPPAPAVPLIPDGPAATASSASSAWGTTPSAVDVPLSNVPTAPPWTPSTGSAPGETSGPDDGRTIIRPPLGPDGLSPQVPPAGSMQDRPDSLFEEPPRYSWSSGAPEASAADDAAQLGTSARTFGGVAAGPLDSIVPDIDSSPTIFRASGRGAPEAAVDDDRPSRRSKVLAISGITALILIVLVATITMIGGSGSPPTVKADKPVYDPKMSPVALTATPHESGAVDLTWRAGVPQENFVVFKSDHGGPWATSRGTAGATHSTFSNLTPNSPYCFRVIGFKDQGHPGCAIKCINGGVAPTTCS